MHIDTNDLELGDEVRDPITGLAGRVIGFTQWVSGCAVASVQPTLKKDGSWPDHVGLDVTRLEFVKRRPLNAQRATGGPQPTPPAPHGSVSR